MNHPNDKPRYDGYSLYAGLDDPDVYLIDLDGRVVHSWDTEGCCLAKGLPNGKIKIFAHRGP